MPSCHSLGSGATSSTHTTDSAFGLLATIAPMLFAAKTLADVHTYCIRRALATPKPHRVWPGRTLQVAARSDAGSPKALALEVEATPRSPKVYAVSEDAGVEHGPAEAPVLPHAEGVGSPCLGAPDAQDTVTHPPPPHPRHRHLALLALFICACLCTGGFLVLVIVQLWGSSCRLPLEWSDWAECHLWTHPLFESPACSCQMLSVVVQPNARHACPDAPAMLHANIRLEYLDVMHASFDNYTAHNPETSNACRVSRQAVAAMSGHSHLIYLKVSWTQALHDFPLTDLPNLQFLDLTGDGITTLPSTPVVWEGLPQLRTLILDQNIELSHFPPAMLAHPLLDTVVAYFTAACADPAYRNVTKVICNMDYRQAALDAFARAPAGVCRPSMLENPFLAPMFQHCDIVAAHRYPGVCIPTCQGLFKNLAATDLDGNSWYNALESMHIARVTGVADLLSNWSLHDIGVSPPSCPCCLLGLRSAFALCSEVALRRAVRRQGGRLRVMPPPPTKQQGSIAD